MKLYRRLRLLFQIFCLSVLFSSLQATHIVGGDVTYEFVSFNANNTVATFNITFNMYRDTETGGANFDANPYFGVYRETSPDNWIYIERKRDQPSSSQQIEFEDDPCINEPTNVGVETASYEFEVEIPLNDDNYMISYQRCCRNPNILNIEDAGDTGVAFNVIITPLARELGNNSPTFKDLPPIFICNQFYLEEDVSGEDVDGDFLSYSFLHTYSCWRRWRRRL